MSDAQNPFDELSELFIVPTSSPSVDGATVNCELRFGETELVLEDGTVCIVSVRRAFLGLSLSGLSIQPGSEYGSQLKANEVKTKHATKKTTQRSLTGKLSAGLNSLGLTGAVNANSEVSSNQTEQASYETITTLVTPRGGQKWEIVEPDDKALDGRYLAHDKALCRVEPKIGANQREVIAQVFVKQRDLLFRYEPGRIFKTVLSPNKEKLLNILIAKALHSKAPTAGRQYAGSLTISEAVKDYEG